MRNSLFETFIGALVVAIAIIFLVFAISQTDSGVGSGLNSYNVKFSKAVGIAPGTDVRLAGVKVGSVTDVTLIQNPELPELPEAQVSFAISDAIIIPTGSSIRVSSDGLLGGAFLSLETACDPEAAFDEDSCPVLEADGTIINSRGSVDIFELVQQFAGGSGGS